MNSAPDIARALFGVGIAQAGLVSIEPSQMGHKAANLARMAAAGLPVPPAFVLSTGMCRLHREDPVSARTSIREALAEGMRDLEKSCGLAFGGERRPLLVSVRSGAAVSMPGMMDTILNVGLCDRSVRGMLRLTGNPRLAWDSYRRLVQQFAIVVHRAPASGFEALAAKAVKQAEVAGPRDLDFESLAALTRENLEHFAEVTGSAFPQDPREQLEAAAVAVLDSWGSERATTYRRMHGLSDDLGTALTVQRMVFGNAGGTSGSGVGFTRDPSTGEDRLYLDFLFNAQGEDVVGGRNSIGDTARLPAALPEVVERLENARRGLEAVFGDAQEFEFTVQDGRLYLLQSRSAKRTPWAALRIAVEQVRGHLLEPAEALRQIEGLDLERLERRRLEADGTAQLAAAEPASLGVATGAIALDLKGCERLRAKGKPVILVRADTSAEDIAGIAASAGLLTARGGRTSHAAVVARQLGKVCLVGCAQLRIDLKSRVIRLGGRALKEGETICLDAEGGRVFAGEPRSVVERPTEYLAEVAKWREGVAAGQEPAASAGLR